jgi:hypothetical protein
MDACVDGALSLGNVYANNPQEGISRSAIKDAISKQPDQRLGKVPKYDFVIISLVLAQGTVSVQLEGRMEEEGVQDRKADVSILVQQRLREDTMLWLLNWGPSELKGVKFTVPACKMDFSVDSAMDENEMPVVFNRIDTNPTSESLPPCTPTV